LVSAAEGGPNRPVSQAPAGQGHCHRRFAYWSSLPTLGLPSAPTPESFRRTEINLKNPQNPRTHSTPTAGTAAGVPLFSLHSVAVRNYVALVIATATRLARHWGPDRADDIAQLVAAQFLANAEHIMANYKPEVFAAVAVRHRREDWRRSERIQRGQGAREITTADGTRRAARTVGSIDDTQFFTGDPTARSGDIADQAAAIIDVRAALELLDTRQRKLVWLVDVEGYTVSEAAATVGLTRVYAQRLLGAARQFIREYVTAA